MKIGIYSNNLSFKPKIPSIKIIRTRGVINDNSVVVIWRDKAMVILL